ncbi:glycosyltransferase [Halorubrum sp. SS5]|nr:glycosyltransferase [Halorubrum sp. SS5]
MSPYLSIVVPIYNEEDRLERCLNSILNQQNKKDVEVICVDDGSTDNSTDILSKYTSEYDIVHVYRHENNKGYASTISDGLNNSEGQVVAFLDADSYLANGTIPNLIGTFESGADAVFAQVQVGNPEAGLHPMACKVGKQFDESLNFGGALMAFDKSVLLNEGGFNLSAERAGQDVEIRERLISLGYEVVLDDEITVYSDFPTDIVEVLKRKYLAGKTYILSYDHNAEMFDLSIIRGMIFFILFDVMVLFSLVSLLSTVFVILMLVAFSLFYLNKTKAVYKESNRISYIPAYLVYQFIAGQLRVIGYISEFPKLITIVRKRMSLNTA